MSPQAVKPLSGEKLPGMVTYTALEGSRLEDKGLEKERERGTVCVCVCVCGAEWNRSVHYGFVIRHVVLSLLHQQSVTHAKKSIKLTHFRVYSHLNVCA